MPPTPRLTCVEDVEGYVPELVGDPHPPAGDQFLLIAIPPDGEVEVVLRLHPALEHGWLPFCHEHLHQPRTSLL